MFTFKEIYTDILDRSSSWLLTTTPLCEIHQHLVKRRSIALFWTNFNLSKNWCQSVLLDQLHVVNLIHRIFHSSTFSEQRRRCSSTKHPASPLASRNEGSVLHDSTCKCYACKPSRLRARCQSILQSMCKSFIRSDAVPHTTSITLGCAKEHIPAATVLLLSCCRSYT